jgi:hypothetical protein
MTYLLNPDNAAFLAGDNPRIARPRASFLTPIINAVVLLMAAGMLTVSFQLTSQPLQLALNGGVVEGQIIDLAFTQEFFGYKQYYIYDYQVDDILYRSQELVLFTVVSDSFWQSVSVYYARHNPQLSQLDSPLPLWLLASYLGIALLVASFSVGIVAHRSSPYHRWRRLSDEGELYKGEIMGVTIEATERSVKWRLRYRFYPDDKRPLDGLYVYTPSHAYARHPQIGDTLAILYVNDKLYQPL